MNWGTKIAVVLATFMLFIIGSVIFMVTSNKDSLLDDNYYEKGLNFDQSYERKANVNDRHARPIFSIQNDSVKLTFADKQNVGKIRLIRPSNERQDTLIAFFTKDRTYAFSTGALARGKWITDLQWEGDGVPFEYRETIEIR